MPMRKLDNADRVSERSRRQGRRISRRARRVREGAIAAQPKKRDPRPKRTYGGRYKDAPPTQRRPEERRPRADRSFSHVLELRDVLVPFLADAIVLKHTPP